MTINVNNIPSVGLPFTNERGQINAIWYDFLRRFVTASVDGTINTDGPGNTVTAGNGLTSVVTTGDTTLNVGQGQGLAVNANDVSVDINSQLMIAPALDDEILVSDKSDNNNIRKTQVREVLKLSAPGGDDTYVQYNSNGLFAGDSKLTYNGNGTLSINTITPTTTNGNLTLATNGTGIVKVTGTNPIIAGTGSSTTVNLSFAGNNVQLTGDSSTKFIAGAATGWTIQAGSGQNMQVGTGGIQTIGVDFIMNDGALNRSLTKTITASTTQTQGNGALTRDINEVAVVANANDTVTLPAAATTARTVNIFNNGANTLKIFPASGDNLGAGVNASTTLASGNNISFTNYDTTNWEVTSGASLTLTGDVTGSGTGSFATTIANSAVTLAKMADMATSSLIYRKTAGTGAPEVNTLATLKTDLNLSGTNSGDQTSLSGISDTMANFDTACSNGNFVYQSQALGTPTSGTLTNCTGYTDANLSTSNITTNNVSTSKHGFAPILPNDATKYLDGSGAYSVPVGSAGTVGGSNTQVQYNNAGGFGGITGATTDGITLTLVAPILGTPTSGTLTNCTGLPTAGIVDAAVTLAKQANMATASVVYRKTAGAGAPEVNTLATLKTDLGLTGTNSGDQTSMSAISDTKANFNTACSDGDFLFVGDLTQGLLQPQVMARISVGF